MFVVFHLNNIFFPEKYQSFNSYIIIWEEHFQEQYNLVAWVEQPIPMTMSRLLISSSMASLTKCTG